MKWSEVSEVDRSLLTPTTSRSLMMPPPICLRSWEEVGDASDSANESAVDRSPTKPEECSRRYHLLAVILCPSGSSSSWSVMRCGGSTKPDFSLTSQTRLSIALPLPRSMLAQLQGSQPEEQELNAVGPSLTRGNTVGYDNPAGSSLPGLAPFPQASAQAAFPGLARHPNISHRDGIVCEGSSPHQD